MEETKAWSIVAIVAGIVAVCLICLIGGYYIAIDKAAIEHGLVQKQDTGGHGYHWEKP